MRAEALNLSVGYAQPVAEGRSPASAAPVATAPTSLVKLVDVHKTYQMNRTQVQAVRGVSMEVMRGELLAICGPSGSGKTTLLNMIGLIDQPDSGVVLHQGEDVGGYTPQRLAILRNQSVGFIFQNFNLLPVLTALENVMMPLQIRGHSSPADHDKARILLTRVGLGDHLHARPDRMSGGQRQRVAIARALINDPQLVMADEPTANLDTDASHRVMALIAELNASTGVSFVFSTHDHRVIDKVHRRVWLQDGNLMPATGESA
ncbi:MAG: ABC transporter ATP-binding protein [Burkholderiaceae bacterium]|jgi:putative ABC transport system ATP-binding protein|nr:ABC transporter ATP-binding protein [Burkholderiaceae bacterium]